jgi:hypothetical protein
MIVHNNAPNPQQQQHSNRPGDEGFSGKNIFNYAAGGAGGGHNPFGRGSGGVDNLSHSFNYSDYS